MSDTDQNKNKASRRTPWQAPELLDLSMLGTAGNKDAIAPAEGTTGWQGKTEVSPS